MTGLAITTQGIDALIASGGFLRRFCECSPGRCACGLPQTRSGWTVESLTELRDLMALHRSVAIVARMTGWNARDCNIALNALMGRTPVHALAALEALAEAA